jgi:hypothetical protein
MKSLPSRWNYVLANAFLAGLVAGLMIGFDAPTWAWAGLGLHTFFMLNTTDSILISLHHIANGVVSSSKAIANRLTALEREVKKSRRDPPDFGAPV